MVAQAAVAILSLAPAGPGRVQARLRLACGCTVDRELNEDRVLERDDGERFVVGKYPCPEGHRGGFGG
jgi:hypothetical protein